MEFVDSLKESVREKKIKIRPEIRKEEKRIAGQENAGELQFLAARCLFMGGIAFLCGRAAAGAAELPSHSVTYGVGDLAHGFECAADRALHRRLFGAHGDHCKAADEQTHTHAHIKVSLTHFLTPP